MNIRILQLLNGAKQATGLTVIIDVFRAFTVECHLINNGVKQLFAVGDKAIAYEYKKKDPSCILIGEREGVKLPGFDHGNSPSEVENIDFSGKTVVHTTSAGTQGIAGAKNATEIITGSLANARAVAEYIKRGGYTDVSLVCMGLGGKEQTDEDTLCARYIKSLLDGAPIDLTPETEKLKYTSGKKFFDINQQSVFPERDFHLSCRADTFSFVLRAEKQADAYLMQRIDI